MLAQVQDQVSGDPNPVARTPRLTLAVALLLIAAALVLCLRFPNPTPQYDEFYHLLAARSLLHEGDLTINEGARPYTRARLFTYGVAGSQWLFGETLAAARVPSATSAALLVGAVFLWVRRHAGWTAALLSAGMAMLALHPLNYSTMVRFYSPHALAVFGAAVGTYEVVEVWRRHGVHPIRHWVGWALLVVAAALLALHLQVTTVVAATAVGLWCVLVALGWWCRQDTGVRVRSAGLTGIGIAVAVLLFWLLGGFDKLAEVYRRPRTWSAGDAGDYGFYHRMMAQWYAPLWWGLPVWLVLAWRRWRLAVYAVLLTLVPIGLHSLLQVKADRYVLYALPFLFIAVGLGLGTLLNAAWRFGVVVLAPADGFRGRRVLVCSALAVVLAAASLYGWYRVPAGFRAFRLIAGDVSRSPFLRSDWDAAQPTLQPWADGADTVIASAGLKSLYYLDRLDASLSVQGAQRITAGDERITVVSGVVSTPEELRALRGAHASGVVVVEDEHWRHPAFVSGAAADWLEQTLERVPADPAWRMRVFVWGLNPPPTDGR